MANIRRDWLTNQNTDCCFVVIGLVGRQSHSPLLQLKIDPVRQMCPPSLFASSEGQRIYITSVASTVSRRIFIYIRDPVGLPSLLAAIGVYNCCLPTLFVKCTCNVGAHVINRQRKHTTSTYFLTVRRQL